MTKELEALEFIKLDYGVEPKGYELIKSALERLEKLEKALRIVIKKNVEFQSLILAITFNRIGEYNNGLLDGYKLTKEEYNLLKEMMEEQR